MANAHERERRLQSAAREVVDEWMKYKKSLPGFALEAIIDTADIKFPEIGTSAINAAATVVQLGAAAGLSVALLSYTGLKVFRKYREQSKSPYRYLSQIRHAVGRYPFNELTLPSLPSSTPS